MLPNGADDRIREKYRSLRDEDEASAPSFERVMATAESRREPRGSAWALRGLALASVAIIACAAVVALVGPTTNRMTSPSATDGENRASDMRPAPTPPDAAVPPVRVPAGGQDAASVEPQATADPAPKRQNPTRPSRAARRPRTADPSDVCVTCAQPGTDSSDPCATC